MCWLQALVNTDTYSFIPLPGLAKGSCHQFIHFDSHSAAVCVKSKIHLGTLGASGGIFLERILRACVCNKFTIWYPFFAFGRRVLLQGEILYGRFKNSTLKLQATWKHHQKCTAEFFSIDVRSDENLALLVQSFAAHPSSSHQSPSKWFRACMSFLKILC